MTRSILKGRLSSRVGRSCSRLRAEPRPRSLGSGCALACIEASVTIGDADTWTFVVTIRESAEGFKGYEGRHVCARGAKRACGSSFQGTGRWAFFGQSGGFGFGPHAGREEKKSEDLTDKLSLWAAPLVGGAQCDYCRVISRQNRNINNSDAALMRPNSKLISRVVMTEMCLE